MRAGDRIGAYEITGELGNGGMGVVYRATHVHLRRHAAIKVLRPEFGSHSTALDRFLNEARATTAIRHPGIVEIYDYGHTDTGAAYIAMELLEGATLGARLAKHGPLSLADTLAVARGIVAPLAVAHEAGVVHRDLKPENVFLVADRVERVKLLDFGIAKLEASGTRTTAGLILGTPAYMSPEQCRGVTDCDHRADLYALGCVLFELFVGEPPFGRDGSMTDLMSSHISELAPELPHRVPPELRRLVARLLAKAPGDRPRTAHDVAFELDCYVASASQGTALAIAPPARPSLRAAIAAAAGLALSLAAIGAWYRWRRAPVLAQGTNVIAPDALAAPPVRAPIATAEVVAATPVPADAGTLPTIAIDAPRVPVVTVVARPRPSRDAAIEVIPELGSDPVINAETTVRP
ncbi:MAG TPA: serine/threonine-protein kinase [Kofleriaceae bacterium]|jgi:serine/threonine-protein kinase